MQQASTKTVPWLVRRFATKYEWRHVKGVAAIRAVVALWLVTLGVIVCAHGYWPGAFFFVVAGLFGWLAYRMPRWKRALDAENGRASAEAV